MIRRIRKGFTLIEMLIVAVIMSVLSAIVVFHTDLWRSRAAIAASTNDLEMLAARLEIVRSTSAVYDTAEMRAGPWSKNVYFVAGMGDGGKWAAVVGNNDMQGLCGIVSGRSLGMAITSCPKTGTLPIGASSGTPGQGQTVTYSASAAAAMVAQWGGAGSNWMGVTPIYGQTRAGKAQMIAWDFGDGTGAGGPAGAYLQVTHTYTTSGQIRPVKLAIIDSRGQVRLGFFDPHTGLANGGSSPVAALPGTGPGNQPPVARAMVQPTSVSVGQTTTFDASSSSDPDDGIASYTWSFSNGNTASGVSSDRVFTAPGTYTGTVTVTDHAGASSTASVSVTVTARNQPPVAVINTPVRTISIRVAAPFDCAQSYDPDGTVAQCQWNFGDGTTATGTSVSHTFQNVGTYRVRLTVIDNLGATSSDETSIGAVLDVPPVASAIVSPDTINSGQAVSFNGNGSTAPGGYISSWAWRFGDGANGTGASQNHVYNTPGVFTYKLVVTNNTWSTDSTSGTVIVYNRPPVAGSAYCAPMNGLSNTPVTCTASGFSDPDGGNITYSWAMGSNWQQTGNGPQGSSVTGYWTTPGLRNVVVTASDNQTSAPNGAQTTSANAINYSVANIPPTPGTFTCNPGTAASTGVSVMCTASGWSDSDGGTLSYTIDYGDGTILAGPTASHAYFYPGGRVITLTVSDGQGGLVTRSVTFTAQDRPPVISGVSCSPSNSASTTPINCTVSATDPDGGTVAYRLDVVDSLGTVRYSSGMQASSTAAFTLNSPGTFTVKSYAQDNQGSGVVTGPTTTIVLSNVAPTTPSVSCTPASGLDQQVVTCTASGSTDSDGGAISYMWSGAGRTGGATGNSTSYWFSTPGNYTVSVVASDGQGGTSSAASTNVTASNRNPTITSFGCSPTSVGLNGIVTCTESGTDPDGGTLGYTANIYTAGWGSLVSYGPYSSTGTYSLSMPNTPGTYYILSYINDNQGSGWVSGPSVTVNVSSGAPSSPNVSCTPGSGVYSTVFTCTTSGSVDPQGSVITYSWSTPGRTGPGSGGSSTYKFSTPGTYTITATATNAYGNSSNRSTSVVVANTPPPAGTITGPTSVNTATGATYTVNGIADPDGTTQYYVWYVTTAGLQSSSGTFLWYSAPYTAYMTPVTNGGNTSSITFSWSQRGGVQVGGGAFDGTNYSWDATGGSISNWINVSVNNQPPVVQGYSCNPTAASTGATSTCTIAASSSASSLTYTINLYDAYWNYIRTYSSASSSIAVTLPMSPGDYFANGYVDDNQGSGPISAGSVRLTAQDQFPVVQGYSCNPTSAQTGASTTCTIVATDPDGNSPTYAINLYDVNWNYVTSYSSAAGSMTVVFPGTSGTYYAYGYVNDNQGSGWIGAGGVTLTAQSAPPSCSSVTMPNGGPFAPGQTISVTYTCSDPSASGLTYAEDLYYSGGGLAQSDVGETTSNTSNFSIASSGSYYVNYYTHNNQGSGWIYVGQSPVFTVTSANVSIDCSQFTDDGYQQVNTCTAGGGSGNYTWSFVGGTALCSFSATTGSTVNVTCNEASQPRNKTIKVVGGATNASVNYGVLANCTARGMC